MHELNIFWQRLAKSFCHRFGTTIGYQTPANFGFNLFFELINTAFVFIFFKAFFKWSQFTTDFLLACLHEFLQHIVEVEIAQGAVQVVRATHGTSWLHAGETLHRLLGQCSHETLIAIH